MNALVEEEFKQLLDGCLFETLGHHIAVGRVVNKVVYVFLHAISNYLLLYRVKLAIDLKTRKQVAVKILKVKEGKATEFSKY